MFYANITSHCNFPVNILFIVIFISYNRKIISVRAQQYNLFNYYECEYLFNIIIYFSSVDSIIDVYIFV